MICIGVRVVLMVPTGVNVTIAASTTGIAAMDSAGRLAKRAECGGVWHHAPPTSKPSQSASSWPAESGASVAAARGKE